MATSQTSLRPAAGMHRHLAGQQCPYCEQDIPNDKAQEIKARFEAKQREQDAAFTTRLNEQLTQQRTQMEANARAVLEQAQKESAAAIQKAKTEGLAAVAAAREEGRKSADAAAQSKITELTQANAALQSSITQKIGEAERQKNAAVSQFETLKANHEHQVHQRVQEARDALEKEKTAALNAKDAKHFGETQKLTGKLAELQRQLEKKTTEELGEGAEIELLDELKAEFPRDRIEHIGRNGPGADIRHTVIHNGKECGIIVYDSKNRGGWRSDYVTKLARDQRAAKADHAILATRAFPQRKSQVHMDGDVIIANPARVVALVHLIRKHIVHSHALRLSNNERTKKTAALYSFITSRRCTQLLDAIDAHADNLLELQKKEVKAHEANWKQQGLLCRSIQKVRGDLVSEIDRIIGTADTD